MSKIRFAGSAAAVTTLAGMIGLAMAQPAMASGPTMRIVESPQVTIPVASGGFAGTAAVTAQCPEGEFLTGGGATVTAGNSYAQHYNLPASQPLNGQAWWAFATNSDAGAPGKLRAYAICAKQTSVSVVQTP